MDISGFVDWLIEAPVLCCAWLIIGVIAGALARRFMGAEDKPIWSDLILGLAGALLGGFVTGTILGMDTDTGGPVRWLVTLGIAILGAMILVYIGRLLWGRGGRRRKLRR